MKAIVVGSGAAGATIARELQSKGFDVLILEAGFPFKAFTRQVHRVEPLRQWGLLGGEEIFKHIFPPMQMRRSSAELILVNGLTTGGSTVLSCGSLIRTSRGFKEIGLDLTKEYDQLEGELKPEPIAFHKWQKATQDMYYSAKDLNLKPQPMPKVIDANRCNNCGLCELGCARGARWDSRQFLREALNKGAVLKQRSRVKKLMIKKGKVIGVLTHDQKKYKGNVVVLSAGGIGTAQILKNSGLKTKDSLWADIVLTLGGFRRGAHQFEESPMAWYIQEKDYILSPYVDILSHYFYKPWRKVSIRDRVGLMVKLADEENGSIDADGKVHKALTENDWQRLEFALRQARKIMESAGVSGPFVKGVPNGGHLGGTVPLEKEDISEMRPSWLPEGLWVADLSLVPKSQGKPTILLAAAIALKVARKITINSQRFFV